MVRRRVSVLLAVVVTLSLIGAPVTMADWGQQASFSTERIEEAGIDEETPVLRYETLSPAAQDAVRRAIDSSDGSHTVYGREDWPDQFFYSDYAAPGQGQYVVVYEGEHYRLTTYAGGGFPFVYWLLELPFVVYGLALGWVAVGTYRGERAPHTAVLASVPGVAFHLLGPEFDFPLFDPSQFVALGGLATGAVVVGLVFETVRRTPDAGEE